MSTDRYPGPIFRAALGEARVHRYKGRRNTAYPSERAMLAELRKKKNMSSLRALAELEDDGQYKARLDLFLPYLLIRSDDGRDHGYRPQSFEQPELTLEWIRLSPDIALWAGDPHETPAVPPEWRSPGRETARVEHAGRAISYTMYAHVWNLGLAPIVGAKVEFYLRPGQNQLDEALTNPYPWHDQPTLLGVARVDLGSRLSLSGCHAVAKCRIPWAHPAENWENDPALLVARVSALGDPPSQINEWNPVLDRHVAWATVY